MELLHCVGLQFPTGTFLWTTFWGAGKQHLHAFSESVQEAVVVTGGSCIPRLLVNCAAYMRLVVYILFLHAGQG